MKRFAIVHSIRSYIDVPSSPALDNYSSVYAVTATNGSRDNYFNHEAITHFNVTPHSVREMTLARVSTCAERTALG